MIVAEDHLPVTLGGGNGRLFDSVISLNRAMDPRSWLHSPRLRDLDTMARELVLWYARIPLQHLYLSRMQVNGLLAITMSTYLPGPEEEH
jgi:hypothetical protein